MADSSYFDVNFIKSLLQNLNAVRKNQILCDFTLKSKDGKSFPVHKNVLISVSPFFERAFNSGMQESQKDSILLEKFTGEILERIIEFMYTGNIQVNSENAMEILDAALFFTFNNLVEFCTKLLIDSIGKNNIWNFLKYSKTCLTDDLLDACFEWMLKNFETIVDSEELKEMCFDDIQTILKQRKKFNYCEDKFHLIIMKWIKSDLETRQNYLKELIDLLNFELMSKEYLQSDEMIETSKYLNDRSYLIKIIKCSREYDEPKYKKLAYSPVVDSSNQSLYAITSRKIYKFDSNEVKLTFLTNHSSSTRGELRKNFACVGFEKSNIFICGGANFNTPDRNYNHNYIEASYVVEKCEVYSFEKQKWITIPSMNKSMKIARAIYSQNQIFVYSNDNNALDHIEKFCLVNCSWIQGKNFPNPDYKSLCVLDNCIYGYSGHKLYRLQESSDLWECITTQSYSSSYSNSEIIGYNNYIYQFTKNGYCIFDLRMNRWFNDFVAYKMDLEDEKKGIKKTFIDNNNSCIHDKYKNEWLITEKPYTNNGTFNYTPRACLYNDEIYLQCRDTVKVYKASNLEFCKEFEIPYNKKEEYNLEHLISF